MNDDGNVKAAGNSFANEETETRGRRDTIFPNPAYEGDVDGEENGGTIEEPGLCSQPVVGSTISSGETEDICRTNAEDHSGDGRVVGEGDTGTGADDANIGSGRNEPDGDGVAMEKSSHGEGDTGNTDISHEHSSSDTQSKVLVSYRIKCDIGFLGELDDAVRQCVEGIQAKYVVDDTVINLKARSILTKFDSDKDLENQKDMHIIIEAAKQDDDINEVEIFALDAEKKNLIKHVMDIRNMIDNSHPCPCITQTEKKFPCIDPDVSYVDAENTWSRLTARLKDTALSTFGNYEARVCCRYTDDEMLTERDKAEMERHPERWQELCCRWIRKHGVDDNSAPPSEVDSCEDLVDEIVENDKIREKQKEDFYAGKLGDDETKEFNFKQIDGKFGSWKRLRNVYDPILPRQQKKKRKTQILLEREACDWARRFYTLRRRDMEEHTRLRGKAKMKLANQKAKEEKKEDVVIYTR